MPASSLSLEDLVDLELRIAEDADADPAALDARDREIATRLSATDRPALIRGWLAALRDRGHQTGARVTRALRLTRLALVVFGAGAGWGTAAYLLAYDGRTPVNVVHTLAVLVGLQLALLALLGLGALLRLIGGERVDALPLVGDARAFGAWLLGVADRVQLRADAAWRDRDPDARARWRAGWQRLRARRSLYPGVEKWHLFAAMQGFGVAFNLGALTLIIGRVALSDLAFAWATTLDIDATQLTALVDVLAAPWAWAWPGAAPDAALIEATRYTRLAAAYAGATDGRAVDPALVGAWWRFVVMATVVYGLAPRLALWAFARRRAARALAAVPLDTPDVDRIARRLTARRVETRAPHPEVVTAPPERALEPRYSPPTPRTRWQALAWRDFPLDATHVAALVDVGFDGTLAGTLAVSDYAAEQSALAALEPDTRLLVLAEAFEAPDKAVRRFLTTLRGAAGERRPIVVGLVHEATPTDYRPVDPATVRLWRQHLAANEDPYLGVEALEPAR